MVVTGSCMYLGFHRLTGCGTRRRKGEFSRLSQSPGPLCSVARSCPHPCGRTCGAGGPQGPQQAAAAPTPPHPAAATSRASASASAGTGKMLAPGWALARTQTLGNPCRSALGPLPPTDPRPHLPRGFWAAEARGTRFGQGAPLSLREETLAVQRGLDKARIAVELHQIEDLRSRRQGGELESQAGPGLVGPTLEPAPSASHPSAGPGPRPYLGWAPSLAPPAPQPPVPTCDPRSAQVFTWLGAHVQICPLDRSTPHSLPHAAQARSYSDSA